MIRILAFSDYRIHSLDTLLELANSFRPLDYIVYSGDDLERFFEFTQEEILRFFERNINRDFLQSEKEKLFYFTRANLLFKRQTGALFTQLDNMYIFRIKPSANLSLKSVIEIIFKEIKKQSRSSYHAQAFLDKISSYTYSTDLKSTVKFVKKKCLWNVVRINNSVWGFIYIPRLKLGENFFRKLASISKYGIGFVYGNDDALEYVDHLKADRVFFLDEKPTVIEDLAFIGLSDALSTLDTRARDDPEGSDEHLFARYQEKERIAYTNLIKTAERFSGNKIILVSHSPPYGVLDFSERFGQANIGMMAIRHFIMEKDNVILNLCGHSHLNGGKIAYLKRTLIVNTSSHDDKFSKGNVALITIQGEHIDVKWYHVPSFVEELFYNYNKHPEYYTTVLEKILGKRGFLQILNRYAKHGITFLDSLPLLANLKARIKGATWCAIVLLWEMGIRKVEDFLILENKIEEIIDRIKKECRLGGSFEANLRSGIYRLISIQKNKVFFVSKDIDALKYNKRVIVDLEYIQWPKGAYKVFLYGFLRDNVVKQFLFNEEGNVADFILDSLEKGYKFYFYGGADRRYILNLMRSKTNLSASYIKSHFINVHYLVAKSIGIPVDSYSLPDVVRCLTDENVCDNLPISRSSVQTILSKQIDGFIKLIMMNKALRDLERELYPTEIKEIKDLKEANKVDLVLLDYLIKIILHISEIQISQKDS